MAIAVAIAFPCAAAPTAPGGKPHAHAHAHSTAAIGYSRAAEQVLVRARAASGGGGWNLLRGWHESGHQGAAHYEGWFDPLRYGLRTETRDAAGLSVQGFNGQGYWRIRPDGQTVDVGDPAEVARTRTAAFLGAHGFFYPSRFEAHGDLVGVRQAGGRSFDVLAIQPWGGTLRELWFDRRSHLLARIVDRTGPQPTTTELSDYRRVGPVLVAFRSVTSAGGGPAQDRTLDSVVFTPSDRALFSLPRTPTQP
jgi:hypothetical protein